MVRKDKKSEVPRSPKKAPIRGGGYATFLFVLGIGLLAGGVALSMADHFSWQLVKIRRMVIPYGVQGASMAMIGVAVFSMGFVARAAVKAGASVIRALPVRDDKKQLSAFTGQLAADLGNIQRAISQMNEALNKFAHAQSQMTQQIAHNAQNVDNHEQNDGLFRLAASMDKLSGQVEDSLQGLDNKFRTRLESMTNAMAEARTSMVTTAQAQAPNGEPMAQQGAPSGLVYAEERDAPSQEELDVLVELERELLEGDEPNLEFFDAVEDMDPSLPKGSVGGLELDVQQPPASHSMDLKLEDER